MLKSLKFIIVGIGIGAALVYFGLEPKTITKTRIVERQVIITEIDEVITERPDGTKITERHTYREEDKKRQARTESKPARKEWGLGVSRDLSISGVYSIDVQRRILGDFYIQGSVGTDSRVTMGVMYLF